MFDKRLFQLAPGIGRLIAAKVALMWVSLIANAAFVVALVGLLGTLLKAIDPNAAAAAFGSAWFGIFEKLLGPAVADSTSASVTASMPLAGDLLMYLGIFAVIAIVRHLAAVGSNRLGFEAAERVKLSLRERLYRKMLALGPSYSSRVKTADVVQSAGEGIEQIQSFFEQFLPQLFYAVLAPLTLFAILLPVNVPAAVVLLVCAPLIVLIVGMVAMSAARVFKKYWGKYTDLGATFLDDLQGLETLKIFDADERAARDMDVKAEEFRVMTMRVLQIQLRSLTAMDAVAYGGAAAGIGMAAWQYASGSLTLAGGLVIVLLSADFFIPLRQLGSFFHVAMNGMTSTKRIFALLDAPEPKHGDVDVAADSQFAVAFERVGYSYRKDNKNSSDDATAEATASSSAALTDVSFMANPGQLTAIVGVSGSGKSTAAAIVAGTLPDYTGSAALLDVHGKHELHNIAAQSLTRAVTLVSARSHLFAGTLRDNLLMAQPDANDEQLWNALRDARIDDFVRAQSAGLDMTIEPDAANLSGGQRQRIAIARALLHDSAIYVFDEATSSVDVESEARILATIHELAKHKTVLMITHRMANAVNADMILVFSHGEVVEAGKHKGLMAADGEYARMFRAQQDVESVGRRQNADTASIAVTSSKPAHDNASADDNDSANEYVSDNDHVVIADDTATAATAQYRLIPRMLREAAPLTRFMIAACTFGTIGHLAATFLPVFGVFALLALAGHTVWGMGVAPAVIGMVICALLRGVMRYAEQFMNHNVAFRLLALFRSKAFAALRRLAPAKLDGKGKGDLIALITTDVEMLEIFFAHTISPVVIAVTTTVIYAIALLMLNPWMAVVLITAHVTVGVVLPALFAHAVHGIGPKLRKDSAALDDQMLDGMRGIGEIIRFGCGEERVTDIVTRTKQLWAQRARLSRINGRFAGLGIIVVLAFTAVAALVAFTGMDGHIAQSVAAVVLIASSFGPTLALSALPASLTNTFAAARRLFALMDESPAVVERGTEQPAYTGMALDHVSFAYPANDSGTETVDTRETVSTPVLHDYSLTIPRSGVLGVQGPSGRGKSTMLKLLMRYWDPRSGSVTFSDRPLPAIDAQYRRRVQTMMNQETALFDGTIRDNLLIALPDGGAGIAKESLDSQLRDACRKASVLDLIESLPAGFDTPVGELGDRLSEGERQRIGLARVFLRNADLVLFDEPTSRLDALNEAVILQSINTLAREKDNAIMLVSHRESAMRIADQVITV
ncbi:ABC transporter, ATP-binding protein [Bifidobacterium goeldii]|uniref:ABC transporter, ATP-binding protein n=1 Tax=Bifidobacterium goeldii TaxID=2306975 RepID=A0A430FL57_9BIFI|nr:ATP-binding cassette domain-containing protein [Bifidobacterium goeldii]RSX53520.1 ABC transporter, ATP-binding protein [Bifidobacterium goeldii]